jgi:hypothetical protein
MASKQTTISDPARLHALLLNTGLQQKNQPLYQVMHDLITTVLGVNTNVTQVVGTVSNLPAPLSGTVTDTIKPLVLDELIIGNGGNDIKSLGTYGSSINVLHGGQTVALPVFIASATASSSNNNSVVTSGINTTGANFIVAVVAELTQLPLSTITDTYNNTWIPLTSWPGSGGATLRIIYTQNATVGTGHAFTATINNSTPCYPSICVLAFSNIQTVSPFDQQSGNIVTGITSQPGSITPSLTNEVVISAVLSTGTAPTVNGGFSGNEITASYVPSFAFGSSLSYIIETSIAASNPTWSGSSLEVSAIATFKSIGIILAPPSFSPVVLTTDVTGILPIANGGTGNSLGVLAAAAGTLTGTTLASNVVNSSLTSLGTLANLTVTNPIVGSVTGNAATVTTNANLTGVITSVGNATSIASQTGTGSVFVVQNTPTLTTPILGVASATSLAVPTVTTASGALTITPAAGSNVNINISKIGQLYVTATNNINNAADSYAATIINSSNIVQTSSGTIYGLDIISGSIATSGASYQVVGLLSTASKSGASTLSYLINGNFNSANSGTGSIIYIYGIYNNIQSTAASTITTAGCMYIGNTITAGSMITYNGIIITTPTVSGTGAITNSYGINIANHGSAGITNACGLNVLETTGASSTNITFCIGVRPTGVSYSLYNASTVLSYFAGSIAHSQAEVDNSAQYYTPATLGTVTMSAGQQRAIINPAATIAVLTVVLPPTPINNQIAGISFTQAVTALTISAGTNTVVASPTSAAIDTTFRFIYQLSSTSWFPAP